MEYQLKILGKSPTISTRVRVVAECICGSIKTYQKGNITSGNTTSCGCKPGDNNLRHGMSKTATYKSWQSMIVRCTRPENHNWHRYGGRGITVCERWKIFENFYADMGERPEGKQLDRSDNNKGYSADNCRWVTQKENCNNRGNSIKLEIGFFPVSTPQLAELSLTDRRVMYRRWHKYKNVWDCLFPPN